MGVGTMNKVGVVLRSRGVARETNLMNQVNGFDPRVSANAADEAAMLLSQASTNNDLGEITAIMQGVPLVCGSVLVSRGRLRVVYRVMGQLMVLVVTPRHANALSAVSMLEKVVRVMTFDYKNPELSADRFMRRYQEVYMATSMLLASMGAISAGQALTEGRASLDAMHQSPIATAAAAGRKAGQAGGDKQGPDGAEQLPGTSQGGTAFKARRRTLTNQGAQLPIQFGFPTGDKMAGLRPAFGFEPQGTAQAAKAALPFTAKHQLAVMPEQDDIFGALQKAGPAASGNPLDDLLGPPAPGNKKQEGPKKGEDPFAFVGAALSAGKQAGGPAGPPPPPIPPSPLLRQVETYRAEVKGSAVIKAGHSGEVSWLPELSSTQVPVVGFGLQYAPAVSVPETAAQVVLDALKAVRVMPQVVQPGWPEGYVPASGMSDAGGEADLEGFTALVAPSRQLINPTFLRYAIPAGRGPAAQPVRVRLDTTIQPVATGPETAVLLGVQLQLDPALATCTQSVEVKLHVPSLYDLPARARPRGAQMDGARRMLKWLITAPTTPLPAPDPKHAPAVCSLEQLCSGPYAFSAAFLVSGSVAAAKGVLRTVLAEIEVRGKPGTTLSGVLLRQHGFVGPTAVAAAGMCTWRANVTARHG